MSTEMNADAGDLINELKKILGVNTDSELAEALDLKKTAIAQWRRRNSVPAHVIVRLRENRKPSKLADPYGYEVALPAVVGHHGLMVALLLSPSLKDLIAAGGSRDRCLSELHDAASWLDDLRMHATLEVAQIMRDEGLDVHAAFDSLLLKPARLAAIRAQAFGLTK